MVRLSRVDEAGWLLTEHLLRKMAMQECIRHIHLMHRPGARDRELKNCANCARFDNRGERVGEVDSGALPKPADHPPSLIVLERPVRMSLMPEYPLARDDVGMGWPQDKMPNAVAHQRVELLLHHNEPMRVVKGGSSGRRDR